ncbi:MAG TPA: PfkB family carbohydrate kinase [Armatimonadota bacterium]|nr:PfkB family carbohydrate kinase [Armatimonadota bacterium]
MTDRAELDLVVIGSSLVEITPTEMGRSLADVGEMTPLPSGAAANFAGVLAGLGISVGFITRVGDDELGRWLISRLAERGIDMRFAAPVKGQMTPVSFAWMDREGAKTFYFYRFPGFCDPMGTLSAEELDASAVTAGRLFDFTEATVRNEPLRSAALRAAELARAAGREVCYAANYRPSSWRGQPEEVIVATQRRACAAADIALMNRDEARLISGVADLGRAACQIADLGPRIVVITGGEEGALLLACGRVTEVPPRRVKVAYDIGAGDTFHAGLLAGHLRGMPPERAARFASDAAALRITREASAPNPTFDEVLAVTDGAPP